MITWLAVAPGIMSAAQLTLLCYRHARCTEISLAGNNCIDDCIKFHILDL